MIEMRGPDQGKGGFTLLDVLVVLAVIGLLAGITVTAASGARERASYASMRSDLQRIAALQTAFREARSERGEKARYANLDQLQQQMGFTPRPEVLVSIRLNENGWSARVRHAWLPRRDQCALFVGTGARPFRPATTPGVLSCR